MLSFALHALRCKARPASGVVHRLIADEMGGDNGLSEAFSFWLNRQLRFARNNRASGVS